MKLLPSILLTRLPDGRIIANDQDGLAQVIDNQEDFDDYVDDFCMKANLQHKKSKAFSLMCGDPMQQIDELIDSITL